MKRMKRMTKSFAQFQQRHETQSNKSDASSDESEAESNQSHFQYATVRNDVKPTSGKGTPRHGLQFTQLDFEPPIAKLLQPSKGNAIKLDLRKVLLLDSQSTLDLICNRNLVVTRTFRSNKSMRIKSNGGTMVITKKAEISGYHAHVWHNKNAIANIISLRNLIKQCILSPTTVTTRCSCGPVVHRESVGKMNMEFRMHKSGIHYYALSNDASPFDDDEIPGVHTAHDLPGDDAHMSEITLQLDDTEIPGVPAAAIPGVAYAATIPGVASVKLPGVDDEVATNESDDLDEPTTEIKTHAEPVEPAPDAQPAEPQGAAATKDGHDRNVVVTAPIVMTRLQKKSATRLQTMTATRPQMIGPRFDQRNISEASAF
jgi:hypothetical protein